MAWGLANLWKEGWERGYSIWHGCHPVNDFGRPQQEVSNPNNATIDLNTPNFFKKAYPALFSYGCGGIKANQESPVKFGDHIKWALWYFDCCFCEHETFPFVAFGISQRCNALGSAWVQMGCKNFERDARVMAQITMEQLEQAQREEEQGLPISDPAIRLLKSHVHATVGHVMGSDQSCF